ncbi:MAG: hypothetical protein ACE5HQ_07765 [Gemmatimonadota bacterium]
MKPGYRRHRVPLRPPLARRILPLSVLVGGVACLASPTPVAAQWTLDPGAGWVQVQVYYQNTRKEYGENANKRRFFFDGHAITTSVFVTAAVGVINGLDVWAQVPVHNLSFDDVAGNRQRTGFGDPRFWVRIGPKLFGLHTDFPIAIRGGVKLPGADFPIDSEIIPLTEGQTDFEIMLELGHSFYPLPMYVSGWVGYRFRQKNEKAFRDPGDEKFAYVAIGGSFARSFTWKLAGEGLWGLAPVIDGVSVPSGRRKILEILPTLGHKMGPGNIEIGGRFPFSGRNLPAGPSVTGGYFFAWHP